MNDHRSPSQPTSPFAIPLREGPRRDPAELLALPEEDEPGTLLALLGPDTSTRALRALVDRLRLQGLEVFVYELGDGLLVLPEARMSDLAAAEPGDLFERVIPCDTAWRLARRDLLPAGSQVEIGPVTFGGPRFGIIAGSCAVESRSQILETARLAAAAGADVLRAGAFKPRTSPYSFQGLGMRGVELLCEARRATGLPFVTEVMDPADVEPMYPMVDAFQVGARNMQNYALLAALADIDKPVLLKRGLSATLEEWLLAAEYLLAGGNPRVILCERGVRSFVPDTRFTLDLATMALAKRATHLPVIVDPSHATGDPNLILPMSLAALAAGADGLIVEFHPRPSEALSDGAQALLPEALERLVEQVSALAPALGREAGVRM